VFNEVNFGAASLNVMCAWPETPNSGRRVIIGGLPVSEVDINDIANSIISVKVSAVKLD
jgi:hypothetical protein